VVGWGGGEGSYSNKVHQRWCWLLWNCSEVWNYNLNTHESKLHCSKLISYCVLCCYRSLQLLSIQVEYSGFYDVFLFKLQVIVLEFSLHICDSRIACVENRNCRGIWKRWQFLKVRIEIKLNLL